MPTSQSPSNFVYLSLYASITGKTTFAEILASSLSLNLCILNLSHASLDDSSLSECVRSVPPQSVILLEDVDAVTVDTHDRRNDNNGGGGGGGNDRNSKQNSGSKVSFSGLLNAIGNSLLLLTINLQ